MIIKLIAYVADKWSPALQIRTVLLSIQALLSAPNPDDPLEKLRAFAQTVEDNVEIYSQPLKPHLPAIGRLLIVGTFLEDSLRIVTQWGDQLWYLQR